MPETRIDELKSWSMIFGDAPQVVRSYTMYNPRYFFWTHHETILQVSQGAYIPICYEADGFVVSVHSTFCSAQNHQNNKPLEVYDSSRPIKAVFEHLIEVCGRHRSSNIVRTVRTIFEHKCSNSYAQFAESHFLISSGIANIFQQNQKWLREVD